jgi:hypothetical protein
MKTYRITMTTEYIIEANTVDEALDMIDYCYETDSYYDSIEELSEEED